MQFSSATEAMRQALQLAARGMGHVEPNPLVGAVLVDDQLQRIGEGWHQRYGGPHAEIEAIQAAGDQARGGTLFVTLEPCCHQGKTGPCTEAILQAGIGKVMIAVIDPSEKVRGQGIKRLRSQGVEVGVGLLAEEAKALIAPFEKLVTRGRPWVHAKWAMSLDGKIATRGGDSQWVSGEASRAQVHALRGRMDAVVVGIETALLDDPLLTARPPGPRTATRVVVDADARLRLDSQLVRTVDQAPVLVAVTNTAPEANVRGLRDKGVEVALLPPAKAVPFDPRVTFSPAGRVDIESLLDELGRRQFTNILVEGGSRLLGSFFDTSQIDEVHVFLAPKVVGGEAAPSAVGGEGVARMDLACSLAGLVTRSLDGDFYFTGRMPKPR